MMQFHEMYLDILLPTGPLFFRTSDRPHSLFEVFKWALPLLKTLTDGYLPVSEEMAA